MPPLRHLTRCPLLAPQTSSPSTRTLLLTSPKSLNLSPTRSLSTTTPVPAAHASPSNDGSTPHHAGGEAHESHYDPPGGWLFGVKPGEKEQKEGWEGIWVYGYWGSLVLAGIAYAFKPDTSIQAWALEEARRRLEKEGILEDPYPDGGPESKSNGEQY